jgi:hypothetical protein
MKFRPFSKLRSGESRTTDEIVDLVQDCVVDLIRILNETFITSDRIAQNQVAIFQHTAWAAANTALAAMPFFTCPYDLEVTSVSWCGQDTIAEDGTNFRTFTIGRRRDGNAIGTIASRSTNSAGNGITGFVPYALVLESDTKCRAGDVLTVAMSDDGTSPAVGEGGFTIDFKIIREVESS